jgi:hypothetical protein
MLGSRPRHLTISPMSSFASPPEAVPAEIPRTVHLQIVSPSAEPPAGDGWLPL